MATPSGRVSRRPPNAVTRPKKRATKPIGGTTVAISLSRRFQVGEFQRINIPASQPSPLAIGPKMISHGAQASQRRLPGGVAPASAAMAAGSPTLARRVRTLAVSSGSSSARPSLCAHALERGFRPCGRRQLPEAPCPAAPDIAGRACRPGRWLVWKSLLAPFGEDLVDGVAEVPPLFLEAGEGQFSVSGEVVIAARRPGA